MRTRRKVVHEGRLRSAASVGKPTIKRTRKSAARTAPGVEALMLRLAKRCRELRAASGLTQQSAAEQAGIAITYLQVIERGSTNPTVAILSALAQAYGVTLAELFAGV